MSDVKKDALRILPIHVAKKGSDNEKAIMVGEEVESLIDTLGGEIVDRAIQKLEKPVQSTYIGKGKIEEVAQKIEEHDVDVVVLNAMAKPGQIHALTQAFEKVNPQIQVWDRVDLILQIFDKHATSTEAKLQIGLARMRYMGPRIYGMGFVLSRQGGGIGTVGIGETNTELMRRHWRREMKNVQDELDKITKNRAQQLDRRKKAGFKTVSIVGYTNAGKSSLFNLLSGKQNYTKNELFATLDSSVSKIFLPEINEEILISDTIGFIRDLPPSLIRAFKSTLMESVHADLLLHVIDSSDPEVETKIKVVDDILKDLGITSPVVYVFNKIDAIGEDEVMRLAGQYKEKHPVFISVRKDIGIEELKGAVQALIDSSSKNQDL